MCGRDLPDMYALALRLMLHIRQIPPAHVTYITYVMYVISLVMNIFDKSKCKKHLFEASKVVDKPSN